jgi:MFS family permease
MPPRRSQLVYTLLVLLGINTMNFFDRQVLGAVAEPIKRQWGLSDGDLGLLGSAFIYLYAVVGVPLGHWADIGRRKNILAAGVTLWSVLTMLSGLAWGFWSLFVFRLGVGVGEASCAPAANSLLGDLFPAQRRARAISLFMLGLPLGLGLSFVVSGFIAQHMSWRVALLVAGLPGLLFGLLAFGIPEPARGAAEGRAVRWTERAAESGRGGRTTFRDVILQWLASAAAVLRIPTLWWIILSGALHNFNMYALGHFLSSLLIRYYGLQIHQANLVAGVVYGFGGGLGILLGGWLCDRAIKQRINGRLEVAALALLVSAPCLYLALSYGPDDYLGFAAWLLPGCLCMYVYYSGVYATIQDIVEPALRGTAMALYFCAMYLLGAALGPWATGLASDFFRGRAEQAGLGETAAKAVGLHDAMHLIPVLTALLVLVLFAASRTVRKDHERLQQRMVAGSAAH